VKFLLATTDPQKLPVTVLSRCLKFNLKRLLPEQISGQMRHILAAENIAFDAEALEELARGADGSLRDGLSLLDQAIAYGAGSVHAAEVRQMLGTIERGQVFALIEAAHAGDGARLMGEVDRLAEFSPDFAGVLDEIASALHRIQLKQLVADYVAEERGGDAQIAALAAAMEPEEVQLLYQIGVSGRRDLALAPTPRAGFEMTLLRMLAFRPGDAAAMPPRPVAAASAAAPKRPAESRPMPAAAPLPPQAPVKAQAGQSLQSQQSAKSDNVATANIGSDWPALIKAAGLGGPMGQLVQNSVLIGIENGLVRLALKSEFEHLITPQFVDQMQAKLSAALGQSVKVKFEKAVGLSETPADIAGRERAGRQSAAERALDSDPTVQGLLRDFDARIIPASVKPV